MYAPHSTWQPSMQSEETKQSRTSSTDWSKAGKSTKSHWSQQWENSSPFWMSWSKQKRPGKKNITSPKVCKKTKNCKYPPLKKTQSLSSQRTLLTSTSLPHSIIWPVFHCNEVLTFGTTGATERLCFRQWGVGSFFIIPPFVWVDGFLSRAFSFWA